MTLITRAGEECRDFADIVQRAVDIGAGLAAEGLGAGRRIGLVADFSFDYIVALIATLAAGACAVPIPPPPRLNRPAWHKRTKAIVEKTGIGTTLGTALPAEMGVPNLELSDVPTSSAPPGHDPDAEALILFTSGTTGDPRGAVFSHGRLALRSRRDRREGGFGKDEKVLSWSPPYLSAGLTAGIFRPMWAGTSTCLLETECFVETPERWIVEISRRRVTNSSGPNFAYGLVARRLEMGIDEELDLSCWKVAACSGEAINPETIERFLTHAARVGFHPSSFMTQYALTETGTVSFSGQGSGLRVDVVDDGRLVQEGVAAAPDDDRTARRVASSGAPAEYARVAILDDDGAELPDGRVGEIAVETPWPMIGYLDEPEETERRFRNGAFLTQDRGYMSNGELFLVGRSKNTIIIRGRNYQGEDLERIVESVDGVDAGTAAAAGVDAGTTEELVVFAESRMSTDMHGDVTQNVRRRLWDEVGIAVRDVVLCPPGSLPRTGLGKLRRESLKKSYLEGSGK